MNPSPSLCATKPIDAIEFGNEGQHWELMPIIDFCTRPDVVPHFQPRVAAFLDHIGPG
jgi:8-oxo-dGTP diphosphatase